MASSSNLALVEEFFVLMQTPSSIEAEPTLISTSIDLAKFEFTDAELQKLRRLAQRLELALLAEFDKHFEIASVLVEVRGR